MVLFSRWAQGASAWQPADTAPEFRPASEAKDANCVSGQSYAVTFDLDGDPSVSVTAWFYAARCPGGLHAVAWHWHHTFQFAPGTEPLARYGWDSDGTAFFRDAEDADAAAFSAAADLAASDPGSQFRAGYGFLDWDGAPW
jgi:hypothetical protein